MKLVSNQPETWFATAKTQKFDDYKQFPNTPFWGADEILKKQ